MSREREREKVKFSERDIKGETYNAKKDRLKKRKRKKMMKREWVIRRNIE